MADFCKFVRFVIWQLSTDVSEVVTSSFNKAMSQSASRKHFAVRGHHCLAIRDSYRRCCSLQLSFPTVKLLECGKNTKWGNFMGVVATLGESGCTS